MHAGDIDTHGHHFARDNGHRTNLGPPLYDSGMMDGTGGRARSPRKPNENAASAG
jgi:hypothetical protein